MLSFEKLPPDPPCHHPQPLIINDASTSHEQPLDLSNNPPLPKFSIRRRCLEERDLHETERSSFNESRRPYLQTSDYVFTSRSKNIETNWPFSQKNLQLCLKHGVKDLLPPFENLDEVRNQPIKRCMVESERKTDLDVSKSSGQEDHAVLKSSYTKLKEKLTEACTDTTTSTSCRSEGENDFPSTLTSISQSEIEESVPTNRPSRLLLETDTSLEAASVEVVEAAGPPVVVVNKTRSTTRPSGKKCRLVVKFSSHSERSSTEDIASNITTISETMTSKICPVCKTFSSSSNTTLNAHIDQCLSGEATPKWTVDSKPITRYRIKPRKTKLMVDIYTTAQHCTLEDLDRRNGSSWATSVSSFPTQDKEKSEIPVEEKRKKVSSVHPDDIDVGPVYVDANGTKVRILSKFDDAPSPSVPKAVEHLRPRKPLKPGKGSKFLSAKKQKRHASKHHKYLKLAPQSKDFRSPKAHSSQIHGGQETCGAKENSVEGQQMEKQLNSCNPGALRGWASSKRTGVVKKLNRKHVSQNVLVESDQTCLDNCHVEGIRGRKVMNLSGNPISSPEKSGSTENACDEAQASEKSDCSPWRTRAGSPFPGEQSQHQFSQDRTFSPNSCMLNRTYSDVNFAPVLSNNTIGSAADLTKNFDSPPRASKKLSKSRDAPRSNARKFLPPKKNVLAIGSRVSLTESSPSVAKNYSAAKNQGQREEADKEVAAWDPEADQQHDFMHNFAGKRFRKDSSDEVLLSRSTVLQRRKDRGSLSSSRRNEPMALESSQFAPEFYGNDEREKMDTSGTVRDEYLEKVDGLGVAEREDQIHDRETKAVTSPTDPSISNEQEMFYGDELQDGTLGQNVHSTEEVDVQDGQGSYFPEVDPILIPGPPGSFLPSPRDMGSDDFQGNSSLTTSRVQSSQDQLDFIDGDSSDSPVSTTSTISNSRGTKFDPKYSEPLSSIGPQSAQDKIGPGLSRAVSGTSEEINATVAQQITSTAADRLSFDRDNLEVNKISLERGPISFKSNDQPCCCQRKDRTSQGVALNYQESPLLMRRAMAVPAMGKQMGGNPNTRTNTLESGSDMTGSFFLSSCTTSRSEQAVFPVTKSSSGHHPSKGSPDGKGKLSGHGHGDCDSVSPSASNSILRLMGKNLMVANKDEDTSAPPVQAQPHAQTNQLTSQFPTFSGVVPGNLQNQFYNSFQHNFPHGSVILGQDPHNKVGECFRSYSNPRTPQVVARGPASLFPKHRTDGSFVSSMEPHEHKGDCNFPMTQNRSISKPIGGAPAFHIERIMSPPDRHQRKNGHSAFSASKEIIIIDDVPESEADLTCNVAKYSEGLTESQVVCSGIPVPAAPSYNSKRVKNPLSHYESQEPSLRYGSPVLYNTTLHAVPSRLATNSSPVKWSCTTSEGSGVLQRAPFLAAPSPRGHLRSTMYSPSLS